MNKEVKIVNHMNVEKFANCVITSYNLILKRFPIIKSFDRCINQSENSFKFNAVLSYSKFVLSQFKKLLNIVFEKNNMKYHFIFSFFCTGIKLQKNIISKN